MSQIRTVLVTGASGFIGAHVVKQLLEAGCTVKGTARGQALDALRDAFKDHPKFEPVAIENIASDDFTQAFKDIQAIIHVASPTVGRDSVEGSLNGAIEGTLNILRQAVKADIHEIVITGSWGACVDPDMAQTFEGITFTEKSWGRASLEDALAHADEPLYVYIVSKILAEQAAWKFAAEHPQLDLAILTPPFVFGPHVSGLVPRELTRLGSNRHIYQLITGEAGRALPEQGPPYYIHVRDIARAHVLALDLPKLPAGADVQDKRFLPTGGEVFWKDAVAYLRRTRPELAARLPSAEKGVPGPRGPLSTIDGSRARDVLGLKDCVGWEETVDETVDYLLRLEQSWAQ